MSFGGRIVTKIELSHFVANFRRFGRFEKSRFMGFFFTFFTATKCCFSTDSHLSPAHVGVLYSPVLRANGLETLEGSKGGMDSGNKFTAMYKTDKEPRTDGEAIEEQ